MDINDKFPFIQFTIERFDHYYDSVNNKGNLYLTLNVFLLGGIITGYYALPDTAIEGWKMHFGIWILLLLNCVATFFILAAISPFLDKRNLNPNSSVFWFGDISYHPLQRYKDQWSQMHETTLLDDIQNQSYSLACGLYKKFNCLKKVTWFLLFEIVLIAVIAIFKLK